MRGGWRCCQDQGQESLECPTKGLSCYLERDGSWKGACWIPKPRWSGSSSLHFFFILREMKKGTNMKILRTNILGLSVKWWEILIHNPGCWTPRAREATGGYQPEHGIPVLSNVGKEPWRHLASRASWTEIWETLNYTYYFSKYPFALQSPNNDNEKTCLRCGEGSYQALIKG